jgi:hypothetical protein
VNFFSINALKTKAKKIPPKFDKILGCYSIRINQKNKLLCKQQVITAHSHAHHLGVKPTGLHSREATHGTATLLIKA